MIVQNMVVFWKEMSFTIDSIVQLNFLVLN
jgi:hypothetical protein